MTTEAANVIPIQAKSLIKKAALVMAAVKHVPKNGFNSFHNYKYATEADVTECVRENMATQGIMLIPSVEDVQWGKLTTKNGGEERLCTLTVKFTLTDGEESVSFFILGEGQDRGDKATYKAMTGAEKYALMKLFMIPTGDDPEKDDEPPPRPQQRQAPRPAAKVVTNRPEIVQPSPEQREGAQALVTAALEEHMKASPAERTDSMLKFKHGDVYAELKKGRTAAEQMELIQLAIRRPPPKFSELTQDELALVADRILAETAEIPFG